MNHTKEPWSYDQPFDKLLIKTEDEEIARLSLSYYGLDNKAHANAKRIVACVNACAGITNEALGAGIVLDSVKLHEAILDQQPSSFFKEYGVKVWEDV